MPFHLAYLLLFTMILAPVGVWNETTEATLDIYEDIDRLAEHVPPELATRIRHAISHPDIKVLDI